MKGNRNLRKFAALMLVAVMAVLALGRTPSAQAGPAGPGVIPPQAHPYGHTYGEWSNAWWQWAFSVGIDPTSEETLREYPLFDLTGDYCAVGQSGPVWFLAGSQFPEAPARHCDVPAGKALFVPLINIEDDTNHLYTEGDPNARAGEVDAYVEAMVDSMLPGPEYMTASLDGQEFTNLAGYLVPADNPSGLLTVTDFPDPYLTSNEYWYGADNVGPAGTGYYMRSAGYYLMLAPLPAGDHTLHFTSAAGNPACAPGRDPSECPEGGWYFWLDTTYDLTVR